MIYERIMQIRSGQWEIGIIEDHLARPLTEDEMAKAIAKLNAEAEDAATPSAPAGRDRMARENIRLVGLLREECAHDRDWTLRTRRELEERKAAGATPDMTQRLVTELHTWDGNTIFGRAK
jgi:hypothetical protein